MSRPLLSPDHERYAALQRAVADLGFIRRGSLVRRFMPCGKAGVSCQPAPPVLHGPYDQWTRKVRGKTVTVRLSQEEAQLVAEWISNGRRLDAIIRRMEAVSLRATDRVLRNVQKSKAKGAESGWKRGGEGERGRDGGGDGGIRGYLAIGVRMRK